MENSPEHVEVIGHLDAAGRVLDLKIQHPERPTSTAEQLIAALGEKPLGYGGLADSVGLPETGSAYRNAMRKAIDAGLIVKTDDGLYTLPQGG